MSEKRKFLKVQEIKILKKIMSIHGLPLVNIKYFIPLCGNFIAISVANPNFEHRRVPLISETNRPC
jgi:hypothetical protein